ncbi:MAG TPA: CDGSH iron-sulfur domain-containing protein [Candidatus Binataceae bacterium]|nr:CDGSH iron-sulfur domain-containing protein [Candidatus Binataceae bacterium]
MARLVKHEKQSPFIVPEGTQLPVAICACGLSKNKPFCDGTHRGTRDENPGEVYVYDESGRVKIPNSY